MDRGRGGGRRTVPVLLVLVFGLVGWQCRASLGVVEINATLQGSVTGEAPQGQEGRLSGSILSVIGTATNPQGLRFPNYANANNISRTTTATVTTTNSTKCILYYTKFGESTDFWMGEGGPELFAQRYGCPVGDCWATSDKNALPSRSDFDAVLFHPLDTPPHVMEQLQTHNVTWRRSHQRFVLVYMESPLLHPNALQPIARNVFNWTMTYLWESDIPRPYGYFVPRLPKESSSPSFTYAHLPAQWIAHRPTNFSTGRDERAKRPYQVAWIVSNCHTSSQREAYVMELARHINVTIFGQCSADGLHNATTTTCDDTCYEMIRRSYKFMIGLENADCRDYVTEKFFGRLQDFLVIRRGVVRGAPPHSYIDTEDFASPAALAQHLHVLDRDDEAYLSYFDWQAHYRLVAAPGQTSDVAAKRAVWAQAACRLCEKLHAEEGAPLVYDNVASWFDTTGQCTASKTTTAF